MAFPYSPLIVTVLAAFGANPNDDPSEWAALWTDITSDVRVSDQITKTYGRSDETGTADAGTCTLVLNDFDRAYTPYAHNSPKYPNVTRGLPIKIQVDAGDGDTDWFSGFVSSYAPRWDKSGRIPVTIVTVKGVLHRLTQGARKLRSPLYRAYSTTTPLAWWALNAGDSREVTSLPNAVEGGGALTASAASAGTHRLSGVAGGSATGPPGEPVATDMSGGGQLSGVIPGVSATAAWRIEIAFLMDPVVSPDSGQLLQVRFGTSSALGIFFSDSPTCAVEAFDAVDFYSTAPAITADTGAWQHLRLDCSSSGGGASTAWELTVSSIDSAQTASGTATNVEFGKLTGITIAPTGDVTAVTHLIAFEGTDVPSTSKGVLAFRAHSSEVAPQRLTRLCSEEGIPFTLVGGVTGTPMGAQTIDTFVNLLREAEATDHGTLYESGFGLAYRPRIGKYNKPVDFSLLASDLAEPPEPIDDDQHLITSASASRPGGAITGFYEDVEARDTYGSYDRGDLKIVTTTDDRLKAHAAWMVHLGVTPVMRVDRLNLNLRARPALTGDWVAGVVGSRVKVSSLPNARMPEGIDVTIEGGTETIDFYTWDAEVNCSPHDPWEVWQLNSAGSATVVAVNSAATSLKIATSSGPEWSTNSSFEPYYLQSNGEAFTVTDMSTDTPAYIAAGAIASGNNASVVPALPAGITADAGQLLLIWAAIRGSGTATVNTPSGWTQLAVSGNCALLAKYYVTGDAAPTVTFTGGAAGDDTQARMFAFSGLSMELAGGTSSTPAYAAQLNSSAQNIAYPALKIKRAGGVKLFLGWKQDDWTSVATVGDAEIMDNPTTTGNDQGIVADYDIYTTVSDVAAGSFTVTGGASAISRAIVIALRPLQTATVTRGTNGAAVSIAAGSAVKTWREGALSL